MKERITVGLNIIGTTYACISHNSRSTTYFISSRTIPVTSATVTGNTIESMITSILVSHFMRYIIDVKSIPDRIRQTGNTSRFLPGTANNTQTGNTTTTRAEH